MLADDVVCFLKNPLTSIKALANLIKEFGLIAGYKVNQSNSVLSGFNVPLQLKQEEKIRYLGIRILRSNTKIMGENNTLINYMEDCSQTWTMYKLSWLGRIAEVKMILLPKLFVFASVNLEISDKIQAVINKCIWDNKKARIKQTLLEQMLRMEAWIFQILKNIIMPPFCPLV